MSKDDFKPLWGNDFAPEKIAACRAADGLLTLELECSRICNLRCVYCYSSAGVPLPGELSWEEIQSVLDQARELGARRIIVLGGGEPLAWGRIRELLRSIHQRGLGIDLFTNGTLLSPDLARELYDLGVHPVIKMNSRNPAVQDFLAGREGTFEAIEAGLGHLVEAGYPSPGMPLGVQTVVCRHNLEELPGLWAWIRERGMTPYFEMLTPQGRARKHEGLLVRGQELRSLFEELARIDSERYGMRWLPHPPIAGLSCRRHEYTCTVTVNGDVLPCPGVNIPVGNIRQAPLRDILRQSPVIRDLRNIRETIKGTCATCDLAAECYGCWGMAFQATGDYLAPDPIVLATWYELVNKRMTFMNASLACQDIELPLVEEDLLKLVPHRPPMLLLSKLLDVDVDAECGVGEAFFEQGSVMLDAKGHVVPEALVEFLAQTFAAVEGYCRAVKRQAPPDRPGLLTAIRKATPSGKGRGGAPLVARVAALGHYAGFTVIEGQVLQEGELLLTAELKLYQPEDEE